MEVCQGEPVRDQLRVARDPMWLHIRWIGVPCARLMVEEEQEKGNSDPTKSAEQGLI